MVQGTQVNTEGTQMRKVDPASQGLINRSWRNYPNNQPSKPLKHTLPYSVGILTDEGPQAGPRGASLLTDPTGVPPELLRESVYTRNSSANRESSCESRKQCKPTLLSSNTSNKPCGKRIREQRVREESTS